MKNYNYELICCDTDSFTICNKDGSTFDELEIQALTEELNSLFEENIKWELEFYNLNKIVMTKAKNYVLYDPTLTFFDKKPIKIKGAALKASTKEPALKEFLNAIIQAILDDKTNFTEIYEKYVLEANNVTDIKRWSMRKTLTDKTMSSERLNEQKIRDAVEDSEYLEGDRVWVYYKSDDTLNLVEKFDGDYNKTRFMKKCFDTAQIFNTVLDKSLFINYTLKRNQERLKELLDGKRQTS